MSKGVSSLYTESNIEQIRQYPHILGHIAGRDKLTELHSEWIKYVWTSGKSVSLNAHRGSFKSTALIHIGVPWYLLFNPDARICIVRKTYADAADAVATIAKVMEQPEIRELFYFCHGEYPNFRVKREGKIDFTFKRTKTPEGSVTGFGLNSPLVGRHFDFILCDDISTLKDRLSKAEREYTKQIWRELVTNIIDRGKPCCYSGTPWHKDGVESIIPTPKQYTISDCNLISSQELETIRANTTPALFAANYELKFAADDDALFKDPVWDKWQGGDIGTVYAQLDSAYGGEDFCALTIGARRKTGELQLIGFSYHGNIKDWLPHVDKYLRAYRVRKTAVEQNADKGWTSSMLKQLGHSVLEYSESTKKQHKIGTYLYEVWPTARWDKNTDDDYMSQIVDWTAETKEHDDAPDSASSLVRAFFSKKAANSERWKW